MARVTSPHHIKHTVDIRHSTSQHQFSQFPNIQLKQRKPQQAKMLTTKPTVARQNDVIKNTEGGGDGLRSKVTLIYRSCLAHISLAVPSTRTTISQNETFKSETVLARDEPSESEKSKKHQGAIKQKQKDGAHPPLAVPGTIPRKTAREKGMIGRHLEPLMSYDL